MTFTVVIKNTCIQVSIPNFSKNEFGYYASFKTHFQIGKAGVAVAILGFGFGFVIKELIQKDSQWMWDVWQRVCVINKYFKEKEHV